MSCRKLLRAPDVFSAAHEGFDGCSALTLSALTSLTTSEEGDLDIGLVFLPILVLISVLLPPEEDNKLGLSCLDFSTVNFILNIR